MTVIQKVLITTVLAAAVGTGIYEARQAFLRRVEPVYNGKPLTFWAQQYASNKKSGGRKELAREAEFAIQQVGTNAIPFLLDMMQVRDSDLKDNAGKVRRMGAHGLAAIGTNAPAAVPALIELATRHPDEDGRYIAVFALRTLGPAAEDAIPFYIQCLTNKDHAIRNEAAVGLALIPHRHETTYPAFLKYLESIETSAGWELTSAIGLLWRFGTNAKPAVPRLLSLSNDSNPNVREAATNSLLWIDPDAAEKAQVRRRR